MQTFRFRLERVLEWYTRQFELEEQRFNACMAALIGARDAIAALAAEQLAIENDLVSRRSIEAREFAALGLYRLGVKRREIELQAARARCETQLQMQRARLQVADRKVRLLEKLRARRMSEHVYAEARELEELAADAYFAKWASR
jgi:flagellar biosynthesis chaperone FliJ